MAATEADQLRQEVARLKQEAEMMWSGSAASISRDELDIQEQLGGGGFAIVSRGTWHGTPVAVKQWFDPSLSQEAVQEFRQEVMTLQQLRHPHVVQFLGACLRPPHLLLVTEALPHSLHAVIYNPAVELDRKRVLALAADVARALAYLHSRRPAVVHRDLKPANLLVDRAWKVKLCDFGLAANSSSQRGVGTPAYMAPELLAGRPYGPKADVFAFGVVLNELLTRQQPWGAATTADIRSRVLAGQRPATNPSSSGGSPLGQLLASCWAQDAADRPTAAALLDALRGIADCKPQG